MNFLAHLYLSCGDDDLLVGNFIADFISNKELTNYPDQVVEGIMLHRAIDSYTDSHPIVRKSVSRLHESQGKYSPVVMDIMFDYLLGRSWKIYSGVTLEDFATQVYEIFSNRMSEFPDKLRKALPFMIKNKFLESYATEEGLRFTLEKMDERTKFPSDFPSAIAVLNENLELFENEFNQFFPDAISFVDEKCNC